MNGIIFEKKADSLWGRFRERSRFIEVSIRENGTSLFGTACFQSVGQEVVRRQRNTPKIDIDKRIDVAWIGYGTRDGIVCGTLLVQGGRTFPIRARLSGDRIIERVKELFQAGQS